MKDEMMSEETMTTTTTRSGPGFLGRFLRALIKVVFWLLILAALGIGGYFGVQELSQTLISLSADSYETSSRVDLLRTDVNSLMENETAGRRQANDMANEVTALDRRVTAVESELAADLDRQAEQLTALEGRLDELAASGLVISDNVTLLNGGLGALQADIVAYGTDLDGLGGEVDGLQAEVEALTGQTAVLEESLAEPLAGTEDVAELRQILALFRVWELVSRARLHLFEGNAGDALTDIESAQTALTFVMEGASEEMLTALEPIQQRLELAAASLPDDPVTAERDLETGWESLDRLLSDLLGLPEPVPVTPEEPNNS